MNYRIILAGAIFLVFCLNSFAQEKSAKSQINQVNITRNSSAERVDIDFVAENRISNLLVIITGNSQTVFLDNIANFKGKYSKQIDLKQYGKGNYHVQIINDKEKVEKKLAIE